MQDFWSKNFPEGCSFLGMHHHCVCPKLGANFAALMRFSYNCVSCDEIISRSWMHGMEEPADQP